MNITLAFLFFNYITITVSNDTRTENARDCYNSEAIVVQYIYITVYAVLEDIFWNTFMNH
jgi:hypothetical protein